MKTIKIIMLMTFGFFSIVQGAFEGKTIHDFSGKCNMCHGALKDTDILQQKANKACITCHPGFKTQSHPTGIIAKKKIPKQFPLFQGKIECTTCHHPHKNYGKVNSMEKKESMNPYMLRAADQEDSFCYQCHGKVINTSADNFHALAIEKAHIKAVDHFQKEPIRDNTTKCLSCHDGILSTDSNMVPGEFGRTTAKKIGKSHPVDIYYSVAYSKKPRFFRSLNSIDPRLRLVNKKVVCETCHNLYSKRQNHLAMDNFKSRLCLSCHNM